MAHQNVEQASSTSSVEFYWIEGNMTIQVHTYLAFHSPSGKLVNTIVSFTMGSSLPVYTSQLSIWSTEPLLDPRNWCRIQPPMLHQRLAHESRAFLEIEVVVVATRKSEGRMPQEKTLLYNLVGCFTHLKNIS